MIIYDLSKSEERKAIKELFKKVFSSCQINLLFGAGFSMPLLKGLDGIEEKLTKSKEEDDYEQQANILFQFFNNSIKPLLQTNCGDSFVQSREQYLQSICNIVFKRHSSVLHKMINIFTTNYDPLIEQALEKLSIEYSDGFSGRLIPTFSTSNYGKIINKISSIENKTTEIVTANLLKLHGSLSWTQVENHIVYEDYKIKISRMERYQMGTSDFLNDYIKNFAIVNPNKDKFNTTVLNSNYYDQLRIFGNTLEKYNSCLLAFGFSFNDEHIRAIMERSLLNPTLTAFIFAYDKWNLDDLEKKFSRFNNIVLICNDQNLDIKVASELLKELDDDIK